MPLDILDRKMVELGRSICTSSSLDFNSIREHFKFLPLHLNGSAGETQVFENVASNFFCNLSAAP